MTELYQHQQDYLSQHTDSDFYALFWEMGAGKTRAVLEGFERLFEDEKADLLVVIAPNGVHPNWPKRQAPLWLTYDYESITWSSKHSSKRFRDHAANVANYPGMKILAMNVEALSTRGGNASKFVRNMIKRCQFGAFLVIDESTTIKNAKANRSKEIAALSRLFKYRRILTGTPSTESPFDLWMQFEVMDQHFWGRNYYMFRQHHGQFVTRRFGNRAFDEVVGYRNLDELKERIAPHCSEVIKSECLDLPPKVYEVREVELTDEQAKAYRQMKDFYAVQLVDDDITVDTPLAKLQKLHQITTGHIINEDGVPVKIKHNRIKALRETLEELSCKTIIFCQYVEPIKEIMEELGDGAVEYSGRIGDDERQEAVDGFQHDDDVRYIVISLQSSGAYGLDLFAAGAVLYYCNGYSLERRMQSEDRAHRPGQVHACVTYIDFISPGTVDENVQQALTDKIDVASKITRLMSSWLR